MAIKSTAPQSSAFVDTRGPVRLTESSIELEDSDIEVFDGDIDAFAGQTVTLATTPKATAQAAIGHIEDADGALKMQYDFAGIPVKVVVRDPSERMPNAVMVQVGDSRPHKASPVELLTINELAQRAIAAISDKSPASVVQLARLESTILLVSQAAREQFGLGQRLPTRDQVQSELASAMVVLKQPKDIDDAFDHLVASAKGTAQVRRHTDNLMAWNMKWDLVTKPQKSFDFSYFSVERDPYGYAYLGALLALRMRGVEVNGITDFGSNSSGHGFSMAGLGFDYIQDVAAAGANLHFYNRPMTRVHALGRDGLEFSVLASNHDKFCVADRDSEHAEGETGGRNVAGAYHQDPKDNPSSWRDDSVQIKGKAVTSGFVSALRRELQAGATTRVQPDRVNVRQHQNELLMSFQLMETWIRQPALSEEEKSIARSNPAAREMLAEKLFERALVRFLSMPGVSPSTQLSRGETKKLKERALELANDLELRGSRQKYDTLGEYETAEVKVLDQTGAASALPGERYNEIAPDLLQLMKGAQNHIVIENPYVVMTEPMMKAFEDAALRGVSIDIVTNSPESTDSAVTQGFFLNDWKDFLVRVPTARIMVATGQRKFHSKVFVIDGKVSADTSYNADIFSGLINGEIGAVTRSKSFAQNLLHAIQADLDDPANKFREWSIQRNALGEPIRGADGQPVAAFGPEQDVNAKLLKRYKPMQKLTAMSTRIALLSSLDHSKKG